MFQALRLYNLRKIGSLKSDREPLLSASVVSLRSMLIHQETIKQSLEADPPRSPDSWIDYCVCICVCVHHFPLPVHLLPSWTIHIVLCRYSHCLSRV